MLRIKKIRLKNFRCFIDQEFNCDSQLVSISGVNGSGKTAILESLYYSCYLKSFRTHLAQHLVHDKKDYFFIEVDFVDHNLTQDQIQIGYAKKEGKVVKLNKKVISSYKELTSRFKLISLTAEDIALVGGSPENRRSFLNYSLMFSDPSFIQHLKRYKKVLEQRNKLLSVPNSTSLSYNQELLIWTEKLWQESLAIQKRRLIYLAAVEKTINEFLKKFLGSNIYVSLDYRPKSINTNELFEEFFKRISSSILQQEHAWKRSLFGCHLDDFIVTYQDRHARMFASRGQQKLISFLFKVAQLINLKEQGMSSILLLDDFLTDFDDDRIKKCMDILLSLNIQVFLTTPTLQNNIFRNKQWHCIPLQGFNNESQNL